MIDDDINSVKEEAINNIRTWLKEENISSRNIDDEYSDFHVVATVSQTHNIDLVIRKDRMDSVTIAQNMNLSDDDKKAFIHLTKDKKKEFIQDLKSSLLYIGVDYTIQPDKERLEFVHVSRIIYFDGLTKDRLFDILSNVLRAMEMVRLKYETHLYQGSLGQSFLNSFFYL